MSAHKFAIGQKLDFLPNPSTRSIPRGAYTVIRQLPNDSPDREYRVKSVLDGHERVMQESQFVASPRTAPADDLASRTWSTNG